MFSMPSRTTRKNKKHHLFKKARPYCNLIAYAPGHVLNRIERTLYMHMLLLALLLAIPLPVQGEDDSLLLTVILRHDQSKSLGEIQEILHDQGFWQAFPPAGTKIVTWHVAMGVGQIVTLEVPASRLRAVNLALEKTAWKAFRTEFYPTYDLYPVIKDKLANPTKVNE